MIPDEYDPVIDFTWYYLIGMTRFNMPEERVGRLTMTTFNRLYQNYKDTFDLEMRLTQNNTTFAELERKRYQAETWF